MFIFSLCCAFICMFISLTYKYNVPHILHHFGLIVLIRVDKCDPTVKCPNSFILYMFHLKCIGRFVCYIWQLSWCTATRCWSLQWMWHYIQIMYNSECAVVNPWCSIQHIQYCNVHLVLRVIYHYLSIHGKRAKNNNINHFNICNIPEHWRPNHGDHDFFFLSCCYGTSWLCDQRQHWEVGHFLKPNEERYHTLYTSRVTWHIETWGFLLPLLLSVLLLRGSQIQSTQSEKCFHFQNLLQRINKYNQSFWQHLINVQNPT